MPFTRPVAGMPVTVEDFGQPVYDQVTAHGTYITNNTPTAWTRVTTFLNGWQAFDAERSPEYRKVGDIVYIRGVIKLGTIGATAFTLPAGFRYPGTGATNMCFVVDSQSTFGLVNVFINGDVAPIAPSVNAFVRLDQISYSTLSW